MRVTDILKKEYIISHLRSRSKREVMEELSRIFLNVDRNIDVKAMTSILLAREDLGSTGIGEGIAIPHGKMAGLNDIIMSFGRSDEGINFDSLDGKPAYFFFMIMAPEGSTGTHLKLLAMISRMLKSERFRKRLLDAADADELYSEIVKKDTEF